MSVEYISGILAGAAGSAHAERALSRTSSGRGAAGFAHGAEQDTGSVSQSLEAGDRDGDGRQPWSSRQSDAAEADNAAQSPASPADGAARGQRLDLIG